MFKSLAPNGRISYETNSEIYKQNGINEYEREDLELEETDQIV